MEPTTHSQPQLLRRNARDGRIAGVAAGLGDYFRVDPVLIRLGFLLLVVAGGFGLLLYLIAWLVIPPLDESQEIAPPLQQRLPRTRWHIRSLVGGVLLTVGAIAFLAQAGSWWLPEIDAWPLILVAIGAGLLLLRARRDNAGPPSDSSDLPPSSDVGPVGATNHELDVADEVGDEGSDTDAETLVAEPGPGREPGEDTEPHEATEADDSTETALVKYTPGIVSSYLPSGRKQTRDMGEASRPPPLEPEVQGAAYELAPKTPTRRARRRIPIAWITLAALVVAGVSAALLHGVGGVDVSAKFVFLGALAVCATGLAASTLLGRWVAILGLAAVGTAALAVASLPNSLSLTSGAGESTVRPTTMGELKDRYEFGAGKLTLDLRQLERTAGSILIEAELGVGELVVLLPLDAAGEVEGHATMGAVELFGRTHSGVSVGHTVSVASNEIGAGSTRAVFPAPVSATSRIVIDAEVGIGKLEVKHAA